MENKLTGHDNHIDKNPQRIGKILTFQPLASNITDVEGEFISQPITPKSIKKPQRLFSIGLLKRPQSSFRKYKDPSGMLFVPRPGLAFEKITKKKIFRAFFRVLFRANFPDKTSNSIDGSVSAIEQSSSLSQNITHKPENETGINEDHNNFTSKIFLEHKNTNDLFNRKNSGINKVVEEMTISQAETGDVKENLQQMASISLSNNWGKVAYPAHPFLRRDISGGSSTLSIPHNTQRRFRMAGECDVFISHARPEKFTLAKPLHNLLKAFSVCSFLDIEDLLLARDIATTAMAKAMHEAQVAIFFLTPEFTAREWPIRELRTFLSRHEESTDHERPFLIPVFYGLSVHECRTVYEEDSAYRKLLHERQFFESKRQRDCSTEQARAAMRSIAGHMGVEATDLRYGTRKSDAEIVEEVLSIALRILKKDIV